MRRPCVAVLALAALTACGDGDSGVAASSEITRPIVLVSGKDDHGEVELPDVPVRFRPDGRAVATVADGTLARVVTIQAE